MAAIDLTAGTVMNASAALLNDVARTNFTYAYQVPYLNVALQELQEYFELNNIPATNISSAAIPVNAGISVLNYNVIPGLPDDMIEPQQLWERERGIDPYVPMTPVEFLPHNLEGVSLNQLVYWTWQNQEIRFLPSNQNNDVKLDYIQNLFVPVVDENSLINLVNAATFLEYRTAALCAEFIGENKTRADDLNTFAGLAIDRTTGIGTKGKQGMVTRRRPFRSNWKRRGNSW